MESFGILCVQIINVIVYLDLENVPDCLILSRSTMKAKEEILRTWISAGEGSYYKSRIVSLNERS